MARGQDLAHRLQRELKAAGTPERAKNEKAYLKSELLHYGVPMPILRRHVVAALNEAGELTRAELLAAVDTLWATGVHELRMSAIELLVKRVKLLASTDAKRVEQLLRESKTWAYVDVLATHVIGRLVTVDPKLVRMLDRWAKDEDFWIRRSALLALLGPLREGAGDFERFARYADAMLDEKEFFIRKAIGWILRDVARKRPQLVYDWLAPRAARASGVTKREAVKYLAAAQKRQIMNAS
jgi:3-methyladenine DNA glycosylase AlkD